MLYTHWRCNMEPMPTERTCITLKALLKAGRWPESCRSTTAVSASRIIPQGSPLAACAAHGWPRLERQGSCRPDIKASTLLLRLDSERLR